MKVKIETYKSKKGERIQYNKDGGAREYNIKKESPLTYIKKTRDMLMTNQWVVISHNVCVKSVENV